ncbi:MAG: DNA-binding protein [Candidatus Ranarchaeia archaeon]|jgi:programmed cell death protein 5
MSKEELENIRKKREAEIRQQIAEAQRQDESKQEFEMQKQQAMRQILTPEARDRLNNIKLVKPELAQQIELQLIQLAQSGRLQAKIDDKQLKALLGQISSQKRESKIEFR